MRFDHHDNDNEISVVREVFYIKEVISPIWTYLTAKFQPRKAIRLI